MMMMITAVCFEELFCETKYHKIAQPIPGVGYALAYKIVIVCFLRYLNHLK